MIKPTIIVNTSASGFRVDRSSGCDTGRRSLPFSILETPLGGDWKIELNDRHETIHPGEAVHLEAGTPHRMTTNGGKGMTSSWIMLRWERDGIPLHSANSCNVLTDKHSTQRILEMAHILQKQATFAQEVRFQANALEILSAIPILKQSGHSADQRIEKAINHIRSHLREPLERKCMARIAGLSESRFHDLFKAATGESFVQYVNRQRLQQAATLLLNSSMNIAEIGTACGFSSPYYFSRMFQRATNNSPREFRRKLQRS